MKNLASDPKYADVVKKTKARMAQLFEETKQPDAGCKIQDAG
jgi:hypothetical protein